MKKIYFVSFIILSVLLCGCKEETELAVPNLSWEVMRSAGAVPIPPILRQATEGVYSVKNGAGVFGEQLVLKWSYLLNDKDTTFYLSGFCEKDVTYLILEGKKVDNTLYFEGYWRKVVNTQTGIVRFSIPASQGIRLLSGQAPISEQDTLEIEGVFGFNQEVPAAQIGLQYLRPIHKKPFNILAHRAGGRTADLLPASENSVEMIRLASRLGATGIEIDIRLTKDGIPILYHDNTLNLRLIQKNGLVGPIEDYSYQQLYTLVRLVRGERIPTLEEALDAVIYNTSLEFVWLDTKYDGSLKQVRAIQRKYMQKAFVAGRKVNIMIGLPAQEQVERYLSLPDYEKAPALCELDLATVRKTNARIWAPRWTEGLQNAQVQEMKAENRQVFVWTVDVPAYVRQFIYDGDFDGVLSNYPSIVAYYHYTRQ
jgi:glycerophosphoryl diester phosphodiesterase